MSPALPVAAPGRVAEQEHADITRAVAAVLREGRFIGGPDVEGFERAFAAHLGGGHTCVGVGNGSDALVLALTALDLRPGGTVLVAPNDGGFAAGAAQAAGLQPAVTDVHPLTGVVGVADVEAAWTPAVVAVVVTHLHGLVADVEGLATWCREREVRLVEDCAQAVGAALADRQVGTFGDAAAFSFYPTKNLGALGDGGALVLRDPEVAEQARCLAQYGWGERYRVTHRQGRNSRLDAVQAAVLTARLPHLDRNNALRRAVVARYAEHLGPSCLLGVGDPGFVAHHAVAVVRDREALRRRLGEAGIGHDVHYPHLVQEMPGIQLLGDPSTPHAAHLRERILTLPCFPTMTADEVDRVCAVLSEHAVARA